MADNWGKDDVSQGRQRVRRLLRPVEDRFGVVLGWRTHRASQSGWAGRSIEESLAAVGPIARPDAPATPTTPIDPESGPPIFVLGATWRSGSTLLQRLLLSSGDVMMWGEPWNRCDLVQQLRESLKPIDDRWPVRGHVVDELDADRPLHEMMVPDLYPPRADLLAAHRALFDRLYAEPARQRGYGRWGMKETRLGADDARYLHALYPDARIVMLYRDPYDSWSSYVALRAMGYARWPEQPIVTPRQFGEMWRQRVEGFLAYPDDLPHLTVSYESMLNDPSVLDRLGEFCQVTPDRSTLEVKVGRSHGARRPEASMARVEKAVGAVAGQLGYERPLD